mgnify:CR=1 FL=1
MNRTRMLSIALTVGAALATLFAVVQFLAPTRGFDAGPSQAAAPKARSGRAEVAYTTDEAHEMACLAATGAIAIERLQSGSDETGPDPRQTGPCVGGTSGKLTLEAGGSPLECVARFETATGANYTSQLFTNTAGVHVMQYLRSNLGVELDPHSHETQIGRAHV